jgi:hypothetical protein
MLVINVVKTAIKDDIKYIYGDFLGIVRHCAITLTLKSLLHLFGTCAWMLTMLMLGATFRKAGTSFQST